ncbi:MAG: queuosine precursor transporter [Chloroflexota bacterium]|nr:queuosine precursor transporter [Dehalococcoidia bacterium]MDW8252409.1 queuosine precursor transporter [Chloroflexota bacterium]
MRPQYSFAFVVVVALFVSSLITANIAAVKLIAVGPLVMDAGNIIFPVSYLVGDVLTEVYGYAAARRVIWLGFLCNLLAVVVFSIGRVLPAPEFWEAQAAYEAILGYTPRLLLASLLAYLVGSFANSYVLARLKVATEGRWLWTRTISSTIVGQGLDSTLFVLIAFAGTIPAEALFLTILTNWGFKSAYEALATPLTYAVVTRLKRLEGSDPFDRTTNFNPLALAR